MRRFARNMLRGLVRLAFLTGGVASGIYLAYARPFSVPAALPLVAGIAVLLLAVDRVLPELLPGGGPRPNGIHRHNIKLAGLLLALAAATLWSRSSWYESTQGLLFSALVACAIGVGIAYIILDKQAARDVSNTF